MSNIITFIGPRLSESGPIGGYSNIPPVQGEIKKYIYKILQESPNVILLSSILPGIEWWAVEAAKSLKIPYTVVVPFDNYESKWPKRVQRDYTNFCDNALDVVKIDIGDFSVEKMRNKDAKLLEADIIHSFYPVNTKEIDFAINAGKNIIRYFPIEETSLGGSKYFIPKDTQTWAITF